jgi:hypothetical protein
MDPGEEAPRTLRKRRPRLVYLLLVVPYLGVLWVPFYNRTGPEFWGVPFFYWYQLFWIPLGAVLLYPVYRAVRDEP